MSLYFFVHDFSQAVESTDFHRYVGYVPAFSGSELHGWLDAVPYGDSAIFFNYKDAEPAEDKLYVLFLGVPFTRQEEVEPSFTVQLSEAFEALFSEIITATQAAIATVATSSYVSEIEDCNRLGLVVEAVMHPGILDKYFSGRPVTRHFSVVK